MSLAQEILIEDLEDNVDRLQIPVAFFGHNSPIYVNIPISDAQVVEEITTENVDENQDRDVVIEFPRPVIMRPPLKTVAKKPSKREHEEKALLEEFNKLSEAEIVIPMIPHTPKPRMRKQNLMQIKKTFIECPTPKCKYDITKAKKRLFPGRGSENVAPKSAPAAPAKVETEVFEIRETLVETRRSNRLNTLTNKLKDMEVYFSCDVCQKPFKDRMILLRHRKTHLKASQ